MDPEYDLSELVSDCASGVRRVVVRAKALGTARADLNLKTEPEVVRFIANGGLEQPHHINTTSLRETKLRPPPKVDEYRFFSNTFCGYFAFYRAPTNIWIIKSLKRNRDPDPRFHVLAEQLRKAGYTP